VLSVFSPRLSPLVLGGALGVTLSACALQWVRARSAGEEAALLRERNRTLAGLLELPVSRVNLKGKTHERVDAVGEGRAIEVHVVVLLVRADSAPGGG
jgi:hypothetical protein